ncbi:single-stranded DNA-binding protein [Embleya hyalina]|uniref:Single-stranded DNA-binding protein n=1 Tax=Embleya hyalina TaxID=516124 RepID=A0A401YHK6_9ACTN|nr:single-stranded DNA-binding protein [Embleya hyalina]GCD94057.1 single-stranded DNA-binding protein [Embleya hyalina]
MAGETTITIVGNLTADPELRFTQSGAAVVNFTIASTPRTFDRETNEWKDGDALFMRCSGWKQLAENVAESLSRGMGVIAQGRLKQRSYEKDGQKRTVVELEVDEIGPTLKWATAKVTKASRSSGQGGGARQQGGGYGQQAQQRGGPPADDPWAVPSGGQQQGGGWGPPSGGGSNEPPF